MPGAVWAPERGHQLAPHPGRDLEGLVPTRWSVPWKDASPATRLPKPLAERLAPSPLFLGDERRGAINRHGAGCSRCSGAAEQPVKALVLTAGSQLPALHPHAPQPGEGAAAGREAPLPPASAGPFQALFLDLSLTLVSARPTPSLSPGPPGCTHDERFLRGAKAASLWLWSAVPVPGKVLKLVERGQDRELRGSRLRRKRGRGDAWSTVTIMRGPDA